MNLTLEPMRRQMTIAAVFLLLLFSAAVMRFTAAGTTVVDTPIRADAKGYVAYSYNWKNHGIYSRQVTWIPGETPEHIVPDALQQPGYPAFLRLFLRDPPDDEFVRSVMYAQACIGIATVAMAFVLSRLILGSLAALFVTALVAFSPHLIVMENYVLSETLFTFLVLAFIGAGVLTVREKGPVPAWAMSTGGLLGLCCLVRPPLTQLAPLLLIATLLIPALHTYRRPAAYGLLGFVSVMTPWWVRNVYEFGHIADPRLMINTLIHGSYPNFLYNGDPASLGYPYRFDPRLAEISQSTGTAFAEITRKFLEQPLTYIDWYLVGKIRFFFDWRIVEGAGDVFTYPVLRSPYFDNNLFIFTHALMRGLHWPLVMSALLGALLAWTAKAKNILSGWKLKAMRWQSLVLAILLFGNMIGAPYPRYSVPFRPLLYLMAVFAILVIADRVRALRESARSVA